MFNSFYTDGGKAFDVNNYGIAKDLFLQAIEKNPEAAESYFYLGKCYFFCDEKQPAISPLKKFIELRQSNSEEVANVSYAFDLLGQCYEMEHKDTATLRCYETATKIYPFGASAWNKMGLLYIKSAPHYLETDLTNSAKLFKGTLAFIKNAQKTYLEAMHFDPEHLIVINQIGMSLFKQEAKQFKNQVSN